MNEKKYMAFLVEQTNENRYIRKVTKQRVVDLPKGDVLVKVLFSSLNYKDILSSIGIKGVTKKYPHTPGIDAAGVIEESTSAVFKPGDQVIVTGYDLGQNTAGGFGQYIRVPANWIVPLPKNLTLRESMIYGTAGFTAALSVYRLVNCGVTSDKGEILVSGASGGVGSIAVSILSKVGYSVVAVNGITDEADYLRKIGAKSVISIEEATDQSKKPMLGARWAGCIDTVGGNILSTAIRSTRPWGAVTSCGQISSFDLPLTVFPFIMRGVTLIGIDSVYCPMPLRKKIWGNLAKEWKIPWMDLITTETSLAELDLRIDNMLKGNNRGRTIVRLW